MFFDGKEHKCLELENTEAMKVLDPHYVKACTLLYI